MSLSFSSLWYINDRINALTYDIYPINIELLIMVMLLGNIKTPSKRHNNLFSPVFLIIKKVNSIYIATKRAYMILFCIFGNNIDVDPQLIFLRELVILNGCEGSQAAFKIDASTSLSMTFKRWVNCYIVTVFFLM